jgi:phenylpyruvate tautomerase PptA (4-oxalocrotonate tautomerase family)
MNVLNYGEESVSVAIEEVEPEDRVEKVYKPKNRAMNCRTYRRRMVLRK